jgi:chemotaxis protein CheY-P-specific phosphatase CheC
MSGQSLWPILVSGPHARLWLDMAVKRAAQALSDTAGQLFLCDLVQVGTSPIAGMAKRIGDPEAKTVGVQLEIKGDACGRALLLVPWDSALNLVDLLTEVPPGTTSDVRFAERTALEEVGNLALAHFLNAVVAFSPEPRRLQPSPANVMVDTLENILRLALMPSIIRGTDPLIIEAILANTGKTVQMRFLILPDYVASSEQTETATARAWAPKR